MIPFFRYGDTINPWGDLITMAKTKCITKKNSRVLLGVPSQFEHPGFEEYIGFNAGRVYGTIQLAHLFANWKQGNLCFRFNFSND